VFVTVSHLKPFLIFAGKAEAYLSGAPYTKGRLLTVPTNIRLEWK